jgi:hypothetical protein
MESAMYLPSIRRFQVAALALFAVVSLSWAGARAIRKSDDLCRRVEEVRLFLDRSDPYVDPDCTYPPSALPVFAALTAPFGDVTVKPIWLALNVGALGLVCILMLRLWARDWPPVLKLVFALAIVASKPVRLGIGLGQFHLIPLLLILLALFAMRTGRRVLAGVLVGIALTKPTMVIPFLAFMVTRRQWTALFTAVGFQAVALMGTSAWLRIGPDRLLREWLELARSQQGAGLIDVTTLVQMIAPHASWLATALGVAVLIVGCAAIYRFRACSELALVSMAGFVAAVSTYHRPYDLVLLFPAWLYLVNAAHQASAQRSLARYGFSVVLGVLMVVPVEPFGNLGLEHAYNAVYIATAYALFAKVCLLSIRESSAAALRPSLARTFAPLKSQRVSNPRHRRDAVGYVLVHRQAQFLGPLRDVFA